MSTNGRVNGQMLLEVENLVTRYRLSKGIVGTLTRQPTMMVHAVEGISFNLREGEMLALVGESGCGKTTTAQTVMRLVEPDSGTIRFEGEDISSLGHRDLRPLRKRMQIIYQDPYESLDPRFRVRQTVEEPLTIHRIGSRQERSRMVVEALVRAGLTPPELYIDRYPHELSGGQQQRVGLCRAMMLQPPLFLLDEPFGALDPVARNDIQQEFLHLQQSEPRTIILVTHDLHEALRLAQRLIVLERGRVAQH